MAVLFISGALAFRYTAREFAPEPARRLDESLWIQEQNAGTYTVASQSCDEGDASDPNAYFNRPFCVNEMRWGFAAIDDPDKPLKHIQPVVHLNDKTRIGTFIGMAPDDLKKIGGIDFVDLNLTDKDYWKLGLTKVKTPT